MSDFVGDISDVEEECLVTLEDLFIVLENGSIVLILRPRKGYLKAVFMARIRLDGSIWMPWCFIVKAEMSLMLSKIDACRL